MASRQSHPDQFLKARPPDPQCGQLGDLQGNRLIKRDADLVSTTKDVDRTAQLCRYSGKKRAHTRVVELHPKVVTRYVLKTGPPNLETPTADRVRDLIGDDG